MKLSKKRFIIAVFESKICFFVFLISLVIGYFLTPKNVFYGFYTFLGIFYIIFFALVMTCMIRVIKEKVLNLKKAGASFFSIILSIFGFSALNVCGIGAPVCTSGITIGFASIFPSFLKEYSIYFLILSIVLQILAIIYMGCLKKCLC